MWFVRDFLIIVCCLGRLAAFCHCLPDSFHTRARYFGAVRICAEMMLWTGRFWIFHARCRTLINRMQYLLKYLGIEIVCPQLSWIQLRNASNISNFSSTWNHRILWLKWSLKIILIQSPFSGQGSRCFQTHPAWPWNTFRDRKKWVIQFISWD